MLLTAKMCTMAAMDEESSYVSKLIDIYNAYHLCKQQRTSDRQCLLQKILKKARHNANPPTMLVLIRNTKDSTFASNRGMCI